VATTTDDPHNELPAHDADVDEIDVVDELDDDYSDGGWDDDWVEDDDEDFVYVPEDRGIVRRIMAVVACIVLFVFLVLGLGGYWLYTQVNPGGGGEAVTLTVPPDAGLATISRLLEEKQVVSNATIFRYYAKWKNIPTIKAGEYDKLETHMEMDSVIERLKRGPLPPKFTTESIPEGLWVADALAKIKKDYPTMADADILKAAASVHSKYQPPEKQNNLTGFLFPATYRIEDGDKDNPQKLLDQTVKKFDQVGDEIGLGDPMAKIAGASGKVNITPYDVVIIASLIEGEAKVPEDRPRIARVIYNRLAKGMPLGIDAALFVALGEHKTEITKSDLAIDSPYNLRKYPGLPPTPINSPGRDSLVAALNPSQSALEPGADTWLYYVLADKEGHHFFTGDSREFDRAVQRARDAGLL
jgi:UPF0755 protein